MKKRLLLAVVLCSMFAVQAVTYEEVAEWIRSHGACITFEEPPGTLKIDSSGAFWILNAGQSTDGLKHGPIEFKVPYDSAGCLKNHAQVYSIHAKDTIHISDMQEKFLLVLIKTLGLCAIAYGPLVQRRLEFTTRVENALKENVLEHEERYT